VSFETPRLIARRLREDDIPRLAECRSHPEVAHYQLWDGFSLEEARELLNEMAAKQPGDPDWFQWALERKADGAYVGDCGLKIEPSDARLGQVGYTIAFPMWGQGYGTEVVRGLIGFAFTSFPNLHRLSADTDGRNAASIRVLEKAGMIREAFQRQSWWSKGEWTDNVIFAILRSDFEAGSG
jgi:[ribosomal protein S5]-alanine N-acetyltransferase